MGNTLRVTIESKYGHSEIFHTNGMLASYVDNRFDGGNTSQILCGEISQREMIQLVAGCLNNIFVAIDDEERASHVCLLGLTLAMDKYMEEKANR